MPIPVTVPRLGWSMEEGTFAGWLKKDGEVVKPGDLLFVLESDKASQEIETLDAGVLRLASDGPKPGDKVQVGQVLAHLVPEGEALPRPVEPGKTVAAGPAARRLARSRGVEIGQVAGSGNGGRVTEEDVRRHGSSDVRASSPAHRPASSPRARRVAAELGIDWQTVKGSGRDGRIRERDVRAVTPSRADGKLVPHNSPRRLIAARMVAGGTEAAPVTLTTRADATNLVNLRRQFQTSGGPVPSYTDLVLKLTALALKQHPLLQAQWRDDGLFVPERIDLAVAVDTDAGLLVPVVREADRLTLRQVAACTNELIALARSGRLTPEQMRDATFTITNLGSFGIDAFTPIVNLPQSAVLGIGRIVREPAVVEEQIVPRDRMTLSLTFDHRIVDGAPAARLLETLRGSIETPAPWLIA